MEAHGRPPAGAPRPTARSRDRYWLHLLLFFLTLVSTTLMGIQLASRILHYQQSAAWFYLGGDGPGTGFPINAAALWDGLAFSLSLLGFLTVHEFGHYFAARRHGIAVSLPYYIPLPFIGVGTLGAVIRIREAIPSTRKLFDVGAAGPIAGFVVALGLLLVALATLPPPSYLMAQDGHEAIKFYIDQTGRYPQAMPDPGPDGLILVIGNTLLYQFLAGFFVDAPPMYELYHYPMLFASWLGLFFTALNLLPVGQLDGGHILYALVGRKWHGRLARAFFILLLISGSVGFVDDIVPAIYESSRLAGDLSWFGLAALLYFFLSRIFDGDYRRTAPVLLGIIGIVVLGQYAGDLLQPIGYWFWLVWCLLIVVVIRIDHPPVLYAEPLTPARRALGILSMLIFILCFSFRPLYVVM